MTKCVKPDNWSAAYTLVYDAWNRLVQVKDGTTTVATYFYDGLNRRIKKIVGSETRLFYFNRNWQCLEERIGGTVDQTYVWGLRYIDDLVTYRKGSTDYYSVADPNWNVIALVNTSGAVQERYTYTSFGKLNVFDAAFASRSTSSCGITRTFTGQTLDAETGLMLYRNRVYHPTLGRFVQRDPIGYNADDANLMRYVGNRVSVFMDTYGFQGGILPPQAYPPFTGNPRPPYYSWYDKPPACSSVGQWEPKSFLKEYCHGWEDAPQYQNNPNYTAWDYVGYGCGGIVALRAGTEGPHAALTKDDTVCFDNLNDAYKLLKNKKCEAPDTKFLLVIYQSPSKLNGTSIPYPYPVENGIVKPEDRMGLGSYNFAALIGTATDGWCWEDGTGSFRDPKKGHKVKHGKNIPNYGAHNLFCVVTDSILQTPTDISDIDLEKSLTKKF